MLETNVLSIVIIETLQSVEMKIERPDHTASQPRQLGTTALALEVHHSGLPGSGAIARAQNWWIAAQRYLERQHVVQRPRPCAQTPWLVPPEQPEIRRSGRPPAAS